jgi:hypothetical protein
MGVAAAALLYAGITAVLFRALLPDLGTHLFPDPGDPLLLAALLGWNASHVPLTPEWWNFPSFAPVEGVTAFTEHMLLTYPVASPIVWATGNPVLAYNVVFLLAKPLNGAAAFALGRELTGSWAAAWIAGLAFAFAPYQAIHSGHLQLMLSFGMPISLLWLHRYLHGGGTRALVWFAVGWLITALANAYLLVFFPLVVVMYCAWFVRPAEWRRLVPPVVAAVLATLALAPLLWGYHVRLGAYGLAREMGEIRAFSADVVSLVGMFHGNTAWRELLPHYFEERALFPGFTILALAIVALCARRSGSGATLSHSTSGAGVPPSNSGADPYGPRVWSRRLFMASVVVTVVVLARVQAGPWGWHFGPVPLPPFDPHRVFSLAFVLFLAAVISSRWFRQAWSRRDPVVFFGVAVAVLWLLALGPLPEWSTPWRFITYGPYWLLMHLPGVDAVRVPARIWLAGVLCLAMLAAYGAAVLLGRYTRRPLAAVAALTLLIVVEGWFGGVTVEVPRPMPAGVIPAGAVVLDLPMGRGYQNAVPQYRAVLGGYRTINGYSGYEPPFFDPFLRGLDERRAGTLDRYLGAGDLYVIVRPDVEPALIEWLTSVPGATQLSAAGDAHIYRLPHRLAAGNR